MSESVNGSAYRLVLLRPQRIASEVWDSAVQTLMQLSDREIVLVAIVDPQPSPDILIVADMEGFPIVSDIRSVPVSFTHLVMEEALPDLMDPDGHPYRRIPLKIVMFLSRQIEAKNQLMAIFNRYRAFAQSLTDLIPADRSFNYESLICKSLRSLLSAEAVSYCEARVEKREVSMIMSDPETMFSKQSLFPLTEAVKQILFTKDRYFDELEPEKVGLVQLSRVLAGKCIVFKLGGNSPGKLPFLLILPQPTSQDNLFPEIELQNALELSAPVLETSHALFEQSMHLKLKSERDPLTKIMNRESLDTFLHYAFANASSTHEPLSALMLDIDHFKRVNDTFGHFAGDTVLLDVTKNISKTLRSNDGFGRYGGEEFVVFLPGLDKAQASAVAERIRQTVRSKPHPVAGPITISIGVSSYPEDVTKEKALIPLADQMMYEAKRSGRDRVCFRNEKQP